MFNDNNDQNNGQGLFNGTSGNTPENQNFGNPNQNLNNNPNFMNAGLHNAPAMAVKKGLSSGAKTALIVCSIVVVGALAFLMWTMFGGGNKSYQELEKSNLKNPSSMFASNPLTSDLAKNILDEKEPNLDVAFDYEVKVTPKEYLLDLISEEVSLPDELTKEATFTGTLNSKDGVTSETLKYVQTNLSFETIFDGSKVYFGLPGILSKYYFADLDTVNALGNNPYTGYNTFGMMGMFIPGGRELDEAKIQAAYNAAEKSWEKTVDKYFDMIADVKPEKNFELEINGGKIKTDKYVFDYDYDFAKELILFSFQSLLDNKEFVTAVADAIPDLTETSIQESLKDAIKGIEEDAADDTKMTLTAYVKGKEIVKRVFEAGDDLLTVNYENYSEKGAWQLLDIKSGGTSYIYKNSSDDGKSGKMTYFISQKNYWNDSKETFEITVNYKDAEVSKDGYINGSYDISFGGTQAVEGETDKLLLNITASYSGKTQNITFKPSYKFSGQKLEDVLEVSISLTEKTPEKVNVPTDAINIENVSEKELSEIQEALLDFAASNPLLSEFSDMASMLAMMQGDGYNDDYYGEDYYGNDVYTTVNWDDYDFDEDYYGNDIYTTVNWDDYDFDEYSNENQWDNWNDSDYYENLA